MRRLFLLMTLPLLFDACVAMCLGASGPTPIPPSQPDARRGYFVFFDWDDVQLSASGRLTLAAAASRGAARIEVLGEMDHAAGPAYTTALAMERARRVRSELLRDGLTPTDISVAGPGLARSVPRRIELVLQWTS